MVAQEGRKEGRKKEKKREGGRSETNTTLETK
jgi:hypothetical protein